MPLPSELPADYADRRGAVHLVAVHVLARARSQAMGRIGLVPTPGGIGTPAFGSDATVVRLAPEALVVETGGSATFTSLDGATIAGLAAAAGADLAADFSAGADTPALGVTTAPLALGQDAVAIIGAWAALGWDAIDAAQAAPRSPRPRTRTQLWPEHFDVGTNVGYGPDEQERVNLGASAGDALHPDPYLYVGPWSSDRPGDPAFWNAPFGAVCSYQDVVESDDPLATAVAFFGRGLALLSEGSAHA